MKICAATMIALLGVALSGCAGAPNRATPSAAMSYVPNYIFIGQYHSPDGTAQVYMDMNQPDHSATGGPNADVKVSIPNQDFYRHWVNPGELVNAADQRKIVDAKASYFSLALGIYCADKTVRLGHAVFFNEEGQIIADHDAGWRKPPAPAAPNSIEALALQKKCL